MRQFLATLKMLAFALQECAFGSMSRDTASAIASIPMSNHQYLRLAYSPLSSKECVLVWPIWSVQLPLEAHGRIMRVPCLPKSRYKMIGVKLFKISTHHMYLYLDLFLVEYFYLAH